jgi:ubiquinone biosynthesis protein COQ4
MPGFLRRFRTWSSTVTTAIRDRDASAFLARVHGGLGQLAFARLAREMAANADGRSLLSARPRITVAAFDPAALDALPTGSLGRAWFHHLRDNGFIADVAVPEAPLAENPLTSYAKTRWRETHDFRHVLTGLGTSIPDETVLAAFQHAQVPALFSLLVMVLGPFYGMSEQNPLRTLAREVTAWRAGYRARSLAAVPYEQLLAVPVDVLRARYAVADLSALSSGPRLTPRSGPRPPRRETPDPSGRTG